MRIRGKALGTAAVIVLLTASTAEAQRRTGDRWRGDPEPAGWVGVQLMGADPVGEFGEVVDQGFGLTVDGALPVAANGAVRMRADAGFVIYGHERQTVCFPVPVGCRVGLDLTTDNTIFFLGVGPELSVPDGALRPYVNATAGFSYFATTSSLSGVDEWERFGDTRNFSDFVGSLKAGGGLRARLKGGSKPIFLDMGVQYHRNGIAEYLREGDIVDEPDGSITIYPNRSEANLVTYRLGVTVGIPHGDDRPDGRRRHR